MLTKTIVKKNYFLTDIQLEKIPKVLKKNPFSYNPHPMILFYENDVKSFIRKNKLQDMIKTKKLKRQARSSYNTGKPNAPPLILIMLLLTTVVIKSYTCE